MFRSKLSHSLQYLSQIDAVLKRRARSRADDRPVGHRIRERHAELQDVGAVGE